MICAYLTALGGGIIRDVIANKSIFSFSHIYPGILVLAVIIISWYFKLYKRNIENNFIFILSDTIGLVSFSISGAIIGLEAGFNMFGVVFLSLITAVGGGMMRDILINEVPFFLNRSFYASISIIIGIILYFLPVSYISLLTVFIIGVILRLYALKKDFHLPKIKI